MWTHYKLYSVVIDQSWSNSGYINKPYTDCYPHLKVIAMDVSSYDNAEIACNIYPDCWAFTELLSDNITQGSYKLCNGITPPTKEVGIYYSEFSNLHYGMYQALINGCLGQDDAQCSIIFIKVVKKQFSLFFRSKWNGSTIEKSRKGT